MLTIPCLAANFTVSKNVADSADFDNLTDVDVVDCNFVSYITRTLFKNATRTITEDYIVFVDPDGRQTAGTITFGTHSVDTTDIDQYLSTTYGSPDFMRLRGSSPGASLNSGNGSETHTGSKVPEQFEVMNWNLY
jgi:hypothetical protein